MKKQVIAVMLSMMMAVGSIGGSSVFAAETENTSMETTAQEASEIAQEEETEELEEMPEENEDADIAAHVEDTSEEESAREKGETIAEEENSNEQDRMEYSDIAEKEDDYTDFSETSAEIKEEIDDKEEIVSTEENNAFGEMTASGTCGENLTWTLDDEGTLIISGTGEMEDLVDGSSCIFKNYTIKSVIIENGVKSIGGFAFYGCRDLASVTIPDSVTSIGELAFHYCNSLTNVMIPNSVTSIGNYAFYDCSSLTSVTIPNSITSIGNAVFSGCSGLTGVTIPDSVTSIGDSAFGGCSSLTSVTIPNSVTSIGNLAFLECSGLTDVTIPSSVTNIGSQAFQGCSSLTDVTIPDSVTSIRSGVFCHCSGLTSIAIPNRVTSIESSAFLGCSGLTDVTIPNSVTLIGESAFYGCSSLTGVTIPNSVTFIRSSTFYDCTSLTSMTIPNSVTFIGDLAFSGCGGLTSLFFKGDAPYSISNTAFKNINATAYYPANNSTWTEEVRQNYGGTITWVLWNPEDDQAVDFHSGVFTINYNSLSGSHEFYYDDLFFYSNNTVYNNALAVLSLGIELASYSYSSKEEEYFEKLPKMTGGYTERAKNIRETYKTLGFTDTKYCGYDAPLTDSSDKVAYSFAKKTITNGTSTDTLVVVPIRGGGYGAEWASNFRVGDSGNSYGFDQAANTVLAELKKYLTGIEITGDLKLWITGYSRAAATANLLTHYINQKASSGKLGVPLNTENVYTYTFATPNCYNEAIGDASILDYNIFNIISSNDMVPKMPLSYWGYKKYGQVMVLPTYTHNDVAAEFEKITGRKLGISKLASLWDSVSDSLFIVVRDNGSYYHNYQEEVSGIFRDEFSRPEGSVGTAFFKMLGTMVKRDFIHTIMAGGYVIGPVWVSKDALCDSIENMHHPEHYLSWLEFGRSDFAAIYARLSADERRTWNRILGATFKNYKRYRIYCPVDVRVYSSDGELLVSIIDNEVVEDQLPCSVYGEEKEFYLLGDTDGYHIELTGSDSGSMSYFVDEYNNDSEVVRSVYYYDIPLEEGMVYQDDVSMEIEDEREDYSVTDGEFTAEKSLDTLTDHTETFSVEVENGAADKAYAAAGEAVMLYAILEEEQEFVRWESDDEDVVFDDDASSATFVKMPSKDIKIVAVLREKGGDDPLIDLSGATVTIPSVTFNGKVQQASVNVALDDKTLARDTDYTVENDTATDAGTYQVTITGIGSYTGTVTKTFLILPGKTTRGDMFNLANNVKVTWKEVPGAKYYKVYREGITDKKETQKEPVIVTERLIGWDKEAGLTNGHAYRYRIVASLTGKGDSSGDSTLSYSKVMYRLKTVVIRSVKNTAPGKVTVKYDKTTSGDSYVLQYCEREDMVGAKTKVVLGANNTSYTIGGLKKGKTYYISIRVRKKVNGIDYYTTFGVPKKVKVEK